VLTIDDSVAAAARGDAQYGRDNVFKRYCVGRGDAAAGLARAEVVVEGTYETGARNSSTSSRRASSP
jgi:hypothetical protein